MPEQIFDVCVVGAGVVGVVCAQGLARQGLSVLLLERLHPMPPCLKAEKISGEAVPPLLRLGFQPAVDASLTPLHSVAVFFGERRLGTLRPDVLRPAPSIMCLSTICASILTRGLISAQV